ncbi:MAG: SurA N-terminal domain-containing protein [Spirochaetes bacterium]|jgi:hypothetical protein|nr:SurA N-terminal domain-containing protein [Spirochaetota bacterium]
MKKNEITLKKIAAYAGVVFISVLLTLFFIGTDVLQFFGYKTDPYTIAVVNGEKIHRFDYNRYRDSRFRDVKSEKMDDLILNNYIYEVLLLQKARKSGFSASDDRISQSIKNIPGLIDPNTGKFDRERFQILLERNHLSITELYRLMQNDIIKETFLGFLKMGIAVSHEDVRQESASRSSRVQIQYAYISNADLRKRLSGEIAVSDDEVSREMAKNKSEIKDPRTDRERIRKKLEDKKFDQSRRVIISGINAISLKGGSFAEASALLRGTVGASSVFTIGEVVKEGKPGGQPIDAINNSKIFYEDCLSLETNSTSRVIESMSGLYIYTPIQKNISKGPVPQNEIDSLSKYMEYESFRTMADALMMKIQSESKIIKNLKTD